MRSRRGRGQVAGPGAVLLAVGALFVLTLVGARDDLGRFAALAQV